VDAAGVPETAQTLVPAVTRKRILVIEDEAQIRQLFEEILRSAGHDVETAGNGVIALEMIAHHRYDLIISDVKMPEMHARDFYAELKRKGAGLERRLIFVTGDLMNPETLQFIESTRCPWLSKPFEIETITRTVADCLNAPEKEASRLL
jgi:CheY-like chemotaxis protein